MAERTEFGVTNVLLQEDREVAEAYRVAGTPSAVLIRPNGTIGSPVAAGAAVLFWNPGCGFCQRMLDELKAWEKKPPKRAPQLVVVSAGPAETNREMGLRSPLGLDDGFQLGRAFGAAGTPSAVLLDAGGNVASGVAVGADDVLTLLRTSRVPREAALA